MSPSSATTDSNGRVEHDTKTQVAGSEVLTIALTCAAVAVSLWYLKRWDAAEEEANAETASLPKVDGTKGDHDTPTGRAADKKGDIESQ